MLPANFQDLWGTDRALQTAAFHQFLDATAKPVKWAYEAWDETLANLTHKDNHNRAIAAQLLSALAKSDPDKRILKDFDRLFNVVRDERFVTARHALLSFSQVGAAGPAQEKKLLAALAGRFKDCTDHKNCTLIRYDIVAVLRDLFDAVNHEEIKTLALRLIETEDDLKYKKKYLTLWPAPKKKAAVKKR